MSVRRAFVTLAALMLGALPCAVAGAGTASKPWIAVSDVHFGPGFGGTLPSKPGNDTNPALLTSLLQELRRVDPDPPVVVLAGDFLAHNNDPKNAAATFVQMARLFDRTYPHAQFLMTLGNNDSPCSDYAAPVGGSFLSTVARAWEPLVNRHGAAPGFLRSFSRDGSYVAALPLPHARAIVINDVSFALRFAPSCSSGRDPAAEALDDLNAGFKTTDPHAKNWLLLHIPPGIDAYSTTYLAHRLAIVPFMRPRVRDDLDGIVGDPKNRVALIVAGHTHKFAYRIAGGPSRVPVLLVPSVSPIFGNAPGFLELGVADDASIDAVREYGYGYGDGSGNGAWHLIGRLGSLDLKRFAVPDLQRLQTRLERSAADRSIFDRLYSAGGWQEINEKNWRTYWCAATAMSSTAFGACDLHEGFSVFTPRALKLLATAALVLVVAIVITVAVIVRKRRARLPT